MSDIARAALVMLDHDRQARILVDDALTLLWANRRALDLIADQRALTLRDGRLHSCTAEAEASLLGLIRQANGEASSLVLCDGAGHLILRCRRIEAADEHVYALTLIGSGAHFESACPGIEIAFDLTRSEYKVLCALMAGQDAEAIASANAVSIETTRSHIKSIYSKMAVNSREAMFRRAIPFLQ